MAGPGVVDALVGVLRAQDSRLEPGLDAAELERAEAAFGLRFPPLWRAVLTRVHPVSPDDPGRYPDWRLREGSSTAELVGRPVAGVLFDVEHNGFWWTSWGPRPVDPATRLAAAREELVAVPVLVPLWGHRYVAPSEHSPVFSIVQTDVHVPALTLADLVTGRGQADAAGWPVGDVAFWSLLHAYSQRPDDPRFAGLAATSAG